MKLFFSVMLMVCAVVTAAQQSFSSKYDFVPGEKLIAFEDFSGTAIGDFPVKWNTNATAEVVTLSNRPGQWLKINKESVFHPEFITNLPENFTLEFDLGVNNEWGETPFALNIASLKSPEEYKDYHNFINWSGVHAVHLQFAPLVEGAQPGHSRIIAGKDGNHMVDNDVEFKVWNNTDNTFAHISIWRQKERLRVYINGEKVWDIPRAFDPATKYNAITFASQMPNNLDNYYVLNNIRLAVGAPDTRNKLITEGKFVTRGILFATNTDKLQPESYGVLKEIGGVMKENPNMRFRIIGHTDSDGDDKHNMDLSRRRAEAVKNALVKEFGVNAANLETDGKGESMPADNNTTVAGKANNRRVEFVKL